MFANANTCTNFEAVGAVREEQARRAPYIMRIHIIYIIWKEWAAVVLLEIHSGCAEYIIYGKNTCGGGGRIHRRWRLLRGWCGGVLSGVGIRANVCMYMCIYVWQGVCASEEIGIGQWAGKVKGSSVRRWLSLNELV